MSQWVRLWEDMPTDPKWRVVARRAGRPLSEVLAVFVFMLTNASKAQERGTLANWSDEDVGAAIDVDAEHVAAIREAMQGKTLDGDRLTGWNRRQPKREDGASERAKEWRNRNRTQQNATERTETQPNAQERPDTDTDTDTEKIEDASASSTRAPSEVSDLRKAIVDAFAAAGSINIPDTSRASIWLERGWKPPICVAVISEILSRKPSVSSLGYFEKAIADAHVAPQGQARPPTNNYGPKPIVVSMTPEDRASALAKTGTRWVEYDTAEWSRVADLWKADKGKYPPHPQGGWYFPESYFAAEHAA
jgi:hypothetical protein